MQDFRECYMLKKTCVVIIGVFLSSLFWSVDANGNPPLKSIENKKIDDYLWMETNKELTNKWLLAETERSIDFLDALPLKNSIEKEFNLLTQSETTINNIMYIGDNYFYFLQTPDFPYFRLFMKNQSGKETLLIDPPVGYGIRFFKPSYDGNYILYGIGENYSETSSIRVLNIQTGKHLPDTISGLRYPEIGWNKDSLSFYYNKKKPMMTDFDQPVDEVYLHYLGMPTENDKLLFGQKNLSNVDSDIDQNMSLDLSFNSDWLIGSVSRSISGYSMDLYVSHYDAKSLENTQWSKILDSSQNVDQFILDDNWLYLARYNTFSGYMVSRLNLNSPTDSEEHIVEWHNGALIQFDKSLDSLYIVYHESGIRKFINIPFSDITNVKNITLPINSEVTGLFTNSMRKDILFKLESWTTPPKIFNYNPATQVIKDLNMVSSTPYSFDEYESEEKWVVTKDGVTVPLTIIHQKGLKLDSSTPTWLMAYGAYGISNLPYFDSKCLIWLKRGGIIAIAHVRGGGELGPAWHDDGKKENKGNSILDFITCAEYLIKNHYTHSSKLVISGASAGGIVIGMAIIERPELFSAAAIEVGMLNMSRLDKIPIGAANFKEFGSPFNDIEQANLLKIDAYMNLQDHVKYPPVLLSVGLKDERVSPWQTAKFAARIKDINGVKSTLILADKNQGHFINNYIDIVNFFLWRTNETK